MGMDGSKWSRVRKSGGRQMGAAGRSQKEQGSGGAGRSKSVGKAETGILRRPREIDRAHEANRAVRNAKLVETIQIATLAHNKDPVFTAAYEYPSKPIRPDSLPSQKSTKQNRFIPSYLSDISCQPENPTGIHRAKGKPTCKNVQKKCLQQATATGLLLRRRLEGGDDGLCKAS